MSMKSFASFAAASLLTCVSCAAQDRAPSNAPAAAPKAASAPAAAAATQPGEGDVSAELAWPRKFEEGGNAFAVYQPQIDKWDANAMHARAAVSVTPAGAKEPTFGVLEITARTDVDKEDRIVTLDDIKLVSVKFPQAPAKQPEYLAMLGKHVSTAAREVPLDQIEANLAATGAAMQSAQQGELKNDPPKVLFATVPSLLVLIDGEPVLREVPGTGVMRVVNTRALILLDSTGRYNLHAMNGWFTAAKVAGPWARASAPPSFDKIAKSLDEQNTVDLLDPQVRESAPKTMPVINVSTTPAELIQTQGEPEYTPIEGTGLLFVKNTDSALFKFMPTNAYYALISGRWFQSKSLQGPWAYVAGSALPADFKKIPLNSPKGNVLVSVPGTPQAQEAVIANAVPQTASVKIAEAKLTVSYDGQPKFKKVDGAKGLQYATNTALPVILIEADKTYWAVQNGIWFTARAATGPWVVATVVPGIIYTIPVSSPVHYVTYVRVYGSTPEVVYVGYTPGYMGTCVSSDGVVVYGTGYYYPAYVGTYWVGYPPTYGYGASFACGMATGLAFGFAAGAIWGDCWTRPYWGPCWGYGHVDINTTNVYHNWRGGVTTVNRHYEWDGDKVSRSGYAHTFNPYTGRASAGGYSAHYNYDNNEFGVKRGGATYNPRTGYGAAGGAKLTGDVDEGTRTLTRGGATYDRDTGVVKGGGSKTHVDYDDGDFDRETGKFRYNTNTDTGFARKGDDFYAGHDGNVYRHTDDNGWQKKTDDGWSDAQKANNWSSERQNLGQQRTARQSSQQRYESSRNSGSSYRSRGGGGGFNRGGGGRGGRR